jgi:peptidyl-prolyl cis-trans isomerase C
MDNKVLAVVNGHEITQNDFEQTLMRFPQERQSFLKTEEGRKQLIDQMICFELMYNYARDTEIDKDEFFIQQLQMAKKEIMIQMKMSALLGEAKVDDKEVEEYYDANKSMYKSDERVTARHILVETLEEAEKIQEEIKKGMDFQEAAKKYSTCPSKAQGGNLGTFTRGQMVPEFEEAAFALKIGQISQPVKTQFGYHIIMVEAVEPSSIRSFDEVKESIKSKILQERQTYQYSQKIQELKNKYPVEIKE